MNSCYHYDWDYYEDGTPYYPYYDILSFVELLANGETNTYSARFVDISSRINRAFADAVVCQQLTSPIAYKNFTMGVTIVDKRVWRREGYDPAYYELMFQLKTGWGNWLKINTAAPTGNPNPLTYGELPNSVEEQEPPIQEEIDYILSLIGKK